MMHLSITDLMTVQFSVQCNQADKLLVDAMRPFKKMEENNSSSIERRVRNFAGTGSLVTQTKEATDCSQLLKDIEQAGLQLVGFFWQARVDKADSRKQYVNVRFTFARELQRDANQNFVSARQHLRQGFVSLANTSFWSVRVYDNPLFVESEPVESKRACSVNLGGRVDRSQKRWLKDQRGQRIGDSPIPIQPARILSVRNQSFVLDPCGQKQVV